MSRSVCSLGLILALAACGGGGSSSPSPPPPGPVPTFEIKGTVTGLAGANFALQLDNGASMLVLQDGPFTLPARLVSGTNYTVSVRTPPVGPGQNCAIANGTGQIAGADVTNVAVTCTTQPFSYLVKDVTATDLVYNPLSGELYASLGAPEPPQILVIDPRTGETKRSFPMPSGTTPLAISDDSQFLYVFQPFDKTIRRVTLPTFAYDMEFPVGQDHVGQPLGVYDIKVAPGNARTIAVTREYLNTQPFVDHGIAVYDDGVPRASTVGEALPVPDSHPEGVLWAPDGTKLYAMNFQATPRCLHEVGVSASGVTLNGCTPMPTERSYGLGLYPDPYVYRNWQMVNGRLYTASGAVYDPALRIQVGAFRTRGEGFAIDPVRNKAFFAFGSHFAPTYFESFNLTRMTPVATHEIAGADGPVLKMVRWGTHGLAAITETRKLLLVSGTFVSDSLGTILIPAPQLVKSTGSAGAYSYRVYDLPGTDLHWDAGRSRLYAAVSGQDAIFGNLIVAIDVSVDRVVRVAGVGSEPTRMAVSDDGTKMYVTHHASSSLERVDVENMRREISFLHNFPGQGAGYALVGEPVPSAATSFAVTEEYPATGRVYTRIIDGTSLRPVSFREPVTTMTFLDASTLFAANGNYGSANDLYELGASASGLSMVRNDPTPFAVGGRITKAGGLLYADAGFAIDPATRAVVRSYDPGIGGTSKAFRADPVRDRGYMAFDGPGTQTQLIVFRLSDATRLATVPLGPALQSPLALASMGANGVAIATTAGNVIVVQGPDL